MKHSQVTSIELLQLGHFSISDRRSVAKNLHVCIVGDKPNRTVAQGEIKSTCMHAPKSAFADAAQRAGTIVIGNELGTAQCHAAHCVGSIGIRPKGSAVCSCFGGILAYRQRV